MGLRTLAVAALCALAAACGEPGPPPARADGERAPERPQSAPRAGERGAAPPRGDRHARAAARRARPVREISGSVLRAGDGRIAIRPRAGRELTLRIGPDTRVVAPGRAAGAQAISPGDEVRASYRSGDADPPTALTVEVRPPEVAPPEAPWTDRG